MQTISELQQIIPQVGRVEWIGFADARGGEIRSVGEVTVQRGTGIDGEHHATRGKSDRQVTLIQHEHLAVVAKLLGRDNLPPELLRRNIVVSGINLVGLKTLRFRIGAAVLEGTGPCAPCSRMEHNLGTGGYHAMRGHGGITTAVIEGGRIAVGDSVALLDKNGT